MNISFRGVVKDGVKNASVWLEKYNDEYSNKTKMKIFPGSLNVHSSTPFKMINTINSTPQDAEIQNEHAPYQIIIIRKEELNGERDILMVPCRISKIGSEQIKNGFIWRTTNADKGSCGTNPAHYILEIVTDVKLRDVFQLQNGDEVEIQLSSGE